MKISRIATGLLAVALLAFLATDVMAQQRGGGRQGGGGRGPGGGGFGGRGGFGGGQPSVDQLSMGLLRVDQVKEAIELMPDQEDALKKMAERQRPERPDFDFQNASEDERQEFFAKMQKRREETAKKMKEQLEEILLPGQTERLREIAIQVLDVSALTDAEVAKELEITDAQKKEMEEFRNKYRESIGELFRSGDRETMREKMGKMREENNTKTLGVLTAEQKSDFEKMKGDKFEMPEGGMRAMFAGGRGGTGGGRGNFGGGRRPGGDGGGQRRRPPREE